MFWVSLLHLAPSRPQIDTRALAIFYNLTNSSLDYARGQHDVFNSIGAAAASGAVFKATGEYHTPSSSIDYLTDGPDSAGVKPAAMSAGIMAGAAGGLA